MNKRCFFGLLFILIFATNVSLFFAMETPAMNRNDDGICCEIVVPSVVCVGCGAIAQHIYTAYTNDYVMTPVVALFAGVASGTSVFAANTYYSFKKKNN